MVAILESEYGIITASMYSFHRVIQRFWLSAAEALVAKPGVAVLAAAMTLAVGAVGCSGRNGRNGKGSEPATCTASRAHIESLYRAEGAEPGDRETRDELLAANVHMILVDCATDPSRFVPCIKQASTSTQLEEECVIPLDDEGRIEAAQFAIAN